ncbi:cytochrome c [Novosphingobium sp.]|uniref:c-type cytochrome n=1 Tax=Novosphingobium sp. TaxID=1874826 RepID=UPI00333EE95D
MKIALALIVPALMMGAMASAQDAAPVAAPDGASLYGRCSACHTATGAGLPGAFPALNRDVRVMASKPAGRRYLALVVRVGMMGPLTVDGVAYRNVMPAQSGLDAKDIAAVLNHIGTRISHDGPPFNLFTAAEVTGYLADAAKVAPTDLSALHATLSATGG